jgi:hypothetical protein
MRGEVGINFLTRPEIISRQAESHPKLEFKILRLENTVKDLE